MKNLNYVSLFAGAGGLDIGLEQAGLKTVSQCEIEPVFCNTLTTNKGVQKEDGHRYFLGTRLFNTDIREINGKELCGGNRVDLVVGGPPCQAFSSAGRQLSVLDPRGLLVNEFVRIVDEVRPKVFLFENVRGFVTARDSKGEPGGVLHGLLERFWRHGYSCRATLLNSADFGSWQRRVRCFILGTSSGRAPAFPEPTHGKATSLIHSRWNTLGDFLRMYADLNEANYTFPTESLARQLHGLPNGSGLKSVGRAETTRPGGHWGYRQGTFIADLTLPARTVTGSSSQDWVRWNGVLRRLTFQEVLMLQGFPADWEVRGTKAQQYKQIGNAVPTVFGRILGEHINALLADFPKTQAERVDMSSTLQGYIAYTKKDQARNGDSRVVHKNFGKA